MKVVPDKWIFPENYVQENHPLKETVEKLVKEEKALLFKTDEIIAKREADEYMQKHMSHCQPFLKMAIRNAFASGYMKACEVLDHI